MKRLLLLLTVSALSATLGFAQSSGNFDAAVNPTVCVLDKSSGNLSPLCTPTADGTSCLLLDTTIKTSNGSGVTLLITPSAVTGLFTDTKLSSTVTTATADIGIKVCVTVTGGTVLPNSDIGGVIAPGPTACVVYDQRFQQISNTLFSNVALCAAGNAGTACASNADCTGGTICGPDTDGDPGVDGTCTCGFDLTLSTLSAHSFNFIAQAPGGSHHVTAEWTLFGINQTSGQSSVAACVGPGDVTVTQTKIFNNSGSTLTF